MILNTELFLKWNSFQEVWEKIEGRNCDLFRFETSCNSANIFFSKIAFKFIKRLFETCFSSIICQPLMSRSCGVWGSADWFTTLIGASLRANNDFMFKIRLTRKK